MRRVLFFIFFIIFFSQIVNSAIVEVDIPKYLKGNISSFSYNYSLNILKFQVEFYNTGSIAYKTRVRIDILNYSQRVFTGWSEEKTLMPGDRKNFEVYWYTNSTGNFTASVRSYFANEIFEQKFNIEKSNSILPEDIFEIKNFRTYDNFVIFDIKTIKDVKNVIVIPSNFPIGWVFEQKKINSIDKNSKKIITIRYYPTVRTRENLTLTIASDEGKYYTEKSFELRKKTGILWLVYYIIDNFKTNFNLMRFH
ncbi:MAG: hypothetical protein QXO27_03785 [Candidatus Aenigmatarchaeota archaeon]